MENIPNIQTESIKNAIPSFDNLYDNNLVHSIEKFDLERQKMHRFIGFLLLKVIGLTIILFFFARYLKNPKSVLLVAGLLLFIVMIMCSGIRNGRPPGYKATLMFGYFLSFCVGFMLYSLLEERGLATGALLVSTMMVSISIGVLLFALSRQAAHYTRKYQRFVLTPLVEHTLVNVRYAFKEKISEQTFIDSNILQKTFSRYDGYDLIQGKYKHINFEFSTVMMGTKRASKGVQHQYIFLTCDLNKTLSGTTHINNNDFSIIKKETADRFMSNTNSFPVETGKPEFEKYFDVYGTYPEESKGLLTPAFIDRLLKIAYKLQYAHSAEMPTFVFKLKLKNQKLYMAFLFNGLNSRNIFLTPRMIGIVDHRKVLQKNYERLMMIMNMIDDFYQSDVEWTT